MELASPLHSQSVGENLVTTQPEPTETALSANEKTTTVQVGRLIHAIGSVYAGATGGNDQHLKFGITLEGMLGFLAHPSVGLLNARHATKISDWRHLYRRKNELHIVEKLDSEGWADPYQYIIEENFGASGDPWGKSASETTRSWLDELVGPLVWGNTLFQYDRNFRGYDLQKFIEQWLFASGHEDKSVIEVILSDRKFAELKKEIGIAHVFWSHTQMEHFLSSTNVNIKTGEWGKQSTSIAEISNDFFGEMNQEHGTLAAISFMQLLGVKAHSYWLDYFALRQCKPDFELVRIMALLTDPSMEIVSSIAPSFDYFHRSFCLLELYGGASRPDRARFYSTGAFQDGLYVDTKGQKHGGMPQETDGASEQKTAADSRKKDSGAAETTSSFVERLRAPGLRHSNISLMHHVEAHKRQHRLLLIDQNRPGDFRYWPFFEFEVKCKGHSKLFLIGVTGENWAALVIEETAFLMQTLSLNAERAKCRSDSAQADIRDFIVNGHEEIGYSKGESDEQGGDHGAAKEQIDNARYRAKSKLGEGIGFDKLDRLAALSMARSRLFKNVVTWFPLWQASFEAIDAAGNELPLHKQPDNFFYGAMRIFYMSRSASRCASSWARKCGQEVNGGRGHIGRAVSADDPVFSAEERELEIDYCKFVEKSGGELYKAWREWFRIERIGNLNDMYTLREKCVNRVPAVDLRVWQDWGPMLGHFILTHEEHWQELHPGLPSCEAVPCDPGLRVKETTVLQDSGSGEEEERKSSAGGGEGGVARRRQQVLATRVNEAVRDFKEGNVFVVHVGEDGSRECDASHFALREGEEEFFFGLG